MSAHCSVCGVRDCGGHRDDPRCPTCGRKPPVKKADLEPTRKKRRVRIDVPDDHEDGFEVFHTLKDECAKELGEMGYTADTPAYFVLVAVMADWLKRESRSWSWDE